MYKSGGWLLDELLKIKQEVSEWPNWKQDAVNPCKKERIKCVLTIKENSIHRDFPIEVDNYEEILNELNNLKESNSAAYYNFCGIYVKPIQIDDATFYKLDDWFYTYMAGNNNE